MLLPTTIDEWVKQEAPVSYDRETIFDYINGAGEVYRSYAFDHVVVDRYEAPGGRSVNVEIFDMGNPQDAYGVFSYSRENEEEGIGAGFERKGSVLCFWQNRFFVCVADEQRSADAQESLIQVATGISAALPPEGRRPALMSVLPAEGLIPFSDRFFHTHQSLNYHYYLARENLLGLGPETDVALARYDAGAGYLLLIAYEGESEASRASAAFSDHLGIEREAEGAGESETGGFFSVGQGGRFLVVVLDAETERAAVDLRAATLANLDQLPE
jgi:hypothetical protein